jgi:hypothetical protein
VSVGRWAAGLGLLALALAAPVGARAQSESALEGQAGGGGSLSLTARTVYNAYEIRPLPDPSVNPFRSVNEFYEAIDVAGFGMLHGDMDVVSSLRFVTDFGTGFHYDTPASLGIPAVDGRNTFQILYLYLDWRNVIHDRLDLRIGRQMILDDLTWYTLDGLKATLHLTKELHLDAYAGRPVLLDALFSSDVFILDGVQVQDSAGFGGLALGASARYSTDDLQISAAYREELVFRGNSLEVFGYPPGSPEAQAVAAASAGKIGMQEQYIGGSVGYTLRPANLDFFAHVMWNLLFGELDQTRAGVAYNPVKGVRVGLEYLRSRPRFAGDSIFNIFNIFAYDRGRADLSIEILRGVTIQAGYLLEKFNGDTVCTPLPCSQNTGSETTANFGGSDFSHGLSGGLTVRPGNYGFGLYLEGATNTGGQYAYGGNYRLAQLFGDVTLFDGLLNGFLRLNYTGFQKDWFNGIDSGAVQQEQVSTAIDIGARAVFNRNFAARLSFTKNFGSVLEGSYRTFSELEVRY